MAVTAIVTGGQDGARLVNACVGMSIVPFMRTRAAMVPVFPMSGMVDLFAAHTVLAEWHEDRCETL
jgi:hypothetical protein